MGSCDINHLKALTLQSSPETIWHINVERKTFEVQFCLGEGKAVIKDYSVKHYIHVCNSTNIYICTVCNLLTYINLYINFIIIWFL